MRRLLAPLSRWLDRRIDARSAAETEYLRLSIEVLSNAADRRNQGVEALAAHARMRGRHELADLIDGRITMAKPPANRANDALAPLPAGHEGLVETAAAGMRDATAVESLSSFATSAPLDAEQTVRLWAAGLTRLLNALRPHDREKLREQDLLVTLAETVGVSLPIIEPHDDEDGSYIRLQVLPYGAKAPERSSPDLHRIGGSHAA